MSKFIKYLSLVLALLMVATCFAACGGKKDKDTGGKVENPNQYEDPDEQAFWDRMGKVNFNGTEISFIVCGGDENMEEDSLNSRSIAPFDTEDLSFAVNSAVVDRNTQVEKSLNVKINLKAVSGMQDLANRLQSSLFMGMHEYDIVAGYQYFDIGLTIGENAGSFLNYEAMDEKDNYISLDQPYWDANLYNEMAYKDCAFWVTGDLSQSWVGCVTVSFVNKTLWDRYEEVIKSVPAAQGITDLYEIVDKGLWTIELVSEISKKIYVDNNANEKIDLGDTVGYISYQPSLNTVMTDVLAAGAHINYSTTGQDGTPSISFDNQRTNLFASKLEKLYNESNALLVAWDNDKYIVEMFAEGNILMTPNYMNKAESDLTEMTDTYVVLPPPLLLANEKYSACFGDSCSQYGIPYTTKNEGKLAAATATLEAMAFYSYKYVTPVYYDLMLKGRYTHVDVDSQKQADIIDMIRDSKFTDFAMLWSNSIENVTWFFRENCTNRNITTETNKKASSWASALEDLLEDIEATYFIQL
ncbi:MAG: hypothetical protein E7616_08395 [Ruminococcaceae bacterium]|nr:hypothetical protein [Oscillospiraceae bacterium]